MGHIQKGKRTEKANSVSSLTIYDQQTLTTQPDGKNAHVYRNRVIVITVMGSFPHLTSFGGLLNVTDTQEALV